MAVLFTSDLHLGHANVIGYCNRPFDDVEAMDAALVRTWNDHVDDDDTVWVLGDVAMGPIEHSLDLVARLAGTKLLVPGNHDRCWRHGRAARRPGDLDRWRRRYRSAGFAEIVDDPHELTVAEVPVRLSHFPYDGDSHTADRFVEHRPADDGTWLLHGHVHDAFRQRGRCINVGVDAWGGRPVTADEIERLVVVGPAELAPLPWLS